MSNTRKAEGIPETPTPASAWKKNGDVLTLPSGNVMRFKNPGIMELAHKGLIPNSLMTIVMASIKKGQTPKPEEVLSESVDMSDMFEMVDNAFIGMAVEPVVLPVPQPDEDGKIPERDPEALYIDDIDAEDKMFVFGWATGGSKDLEQFRKERAGVLATIPGQPTVAVPTKRAPARKR